MILGADESEKVLNVLSSFKNELDKLDVDKLKIVLVDLINWVDKDVMQHKNWLNWKENRLSWSW